MAEKNSAQTNKQTDRQTNRHYENNGHLAVNQKNTKTVGKHGEVVKNHFTSGNMHQSFIDALYKYISEGLMHVATWYHGTPGPNSGNKFCLAKRLMLPNFVTSDKKCVRYSLWKNFSPRKTSF